MTIPTTKIVTKQIVPDIPVIPQISEMKNDIGRKVACLVDFLIARVFDEPIPGEKHIFGWWNGAAYDLVNLFTRRLMEVSKGATGDYLVWNNNMTSFINAGLNAVHGNVSAMANKDGESRMMCELRKKQILEQAIVPQNEFSSTGKLLFHRCFDLFLDPSAMPLESDTSEFMMLAMPKVFVPCFQRWNSLPVQEIKNELDEFTKLMEMFGLKFYHKIPYHRLHNQLSALRPEILFAVLLFANTLNKKAEVAAELKKLTSQSGPVGLTAGTKMHATPKAPADLAAGVKKPATTPAGLAVKIKKPATTPAGLAVKIKKPATTPVGLAVEVKKPATTPAGLAVEVKKPATTPKTLDIEVKKTAIVIERKNAVEQVETKMAVVEDENQPGGIIKPATFAFQIDPKNPLNIWCHLCKKTLGPKSGPGHLKSRMHVMLSERA